MRVWDQIEPWRLCRNHLLGEHREVHAVFTFLTTDKGGAYKRHSETRRWTRYLPALRARHEKLAAEIERRGYNHASPLPDPLPVEAVQVKRGDPPPLPGKSQVAILREKVREKGCACDLRGCGR